jgi:hypothetical protein
MALLLALGASTLALQPSVARFADDMAAVARRSTRRELLSGGAAALGLAALATPTQARASYALYQSSYDSYQDRKATGYVPVATSDKESLKEIQGDIRSKRPASFRKPQKAPQYCAGQTSAVTPMMENICGNIGVSKADQSNTMVDACAPRRRPAPRLPPFFAQRTPTECLTHMS